MGFLLRGMLIGLLFGLPVGLLGSHGSAGWGFGVKAGLLTGSGLLCGGLLLRCMGAFGLTSMTRLISAMLYGNRFWKLP